MDPFGHPDLDRLGRSLRHTLDETLNAEQDAARAAMVRRRTLRDRFVESEDRTELVRVGLVDGHIVGGLDLGGRGLVHRAFVDQGRVDVGLVDGHIVGGFVTGVGVDHVILVDDGVVSPSTMPHTMLACGWHGTVAHIRARTTMLRWTSN